jgi:serine/threonine protein kinase
VTPSLWERVAAALGDQYVLEQELGRGGMSVVFLARDVRLNRPVAIKVLPPELARDPAVRVRFTREAQTSAHLAHPHIIAIHDVGERDDVAWFVMAYVSGGSLATRLGREPRQPVDAVKRLLCEVADALDYAHMRGVIHRDIKPDNILLDADSGRAVVTDFGIARAMEAGARLTVTGIAVGTPAYMSPEQAVGERELDGRSDIYSLGVLGYQMLTGRVPFAASNAMALLLKHVSEPPRPIAELRPEVPRPLREAVERALAKAPEDRWPTAAMLREAIQSGEASAAWRSETREPVRYASPRPGSQRTVARREPTPPPPAPGGVVLEPPHLSGLTPEQRADLRLWHGRVNLFDRVRTARRYLWSTLLAIPLIGIGGLVAMAEGEIPPLIFSPVIPAYMSVKSWKRLRSLKAAGVRLRRLLFMPRAKWVLPAPPPAPSEAQLERLAPREVLDGPQGGAIRRAALDKAAILDSYQRLSKADRAMLSDLVPTVEGLLERVARLAATLFELDRGLDPRLLEQLDARIAAAAGDAASPDGERRLALLKRQRGTLEALLARRDTLLRQLDSAGLALGNLKLDLMRLGSSGIQSAMAEVSTATQEARALSREIAMVLDAADEVRRI